MIQDVQALRASSDTPVYFERGTPVLAVDDVSKEYVRIHNSQRVHALEGISFTIDEGEFVSVIGRSGCGKSTLLRMVAGLLSPTRGKISVDGKRSTQPGVDRGMVFQEYAIFPWKTAFQNVEFPLLVQGVASAERRDRAMHYLQMVNLADAAGRYPRELSGGMKQRVAVARGLCQNPRILLMDEPFAAIDAVQRQQLQEDLRRIVSDLRTTVMFVTHSVDEAAFLSDRVVVLKASPGEIIADICVDLPRERRWTDISQNLTFNDLRSNLLNEVHRGSPEGAAMAHSGGL